MHREIPVSNRVLSRKWEEREQAFHYERLKSIRATLDTAKPFPGPGTRAKSKKEQMEEDRVLEIEQENRKLLERMSAIITAKSSVQTAAGRGKSLNREFRKKELTRVTLENQALLKRLQNRQSSYSTEQWRQDRKETERLLRNICQYPYVLGADSPSELRRQMSQPQLPPSLPDSVRQPKPRALPPLKPVPAETVLKRGLSLGEKYFMVEVLVLKSKIKLKAMDVETQDRFVLKLTKAEARDIVGEGKDRYEKLVERLAFQTQGLVLLGKRKPNKPAIVRELSEKPKETAPLPPKPKALLNPPVKRPVLSNPHTKSEPSLAIPRKEIASKAVPKATIPEEPVEHFPRAKSSSEEGEREEKMQEKPSSPEEYADEYEEEAELPGKRQSVQTDSEKLSVPEPCTQEEAAESGFREDSRALDEEKEAILAVESREKSQSSPHSSSKSSHKPASPQKSPESSVNEGKYEEDEDFQPVSSAPIRQIDAENPENEAFPESKESAPAYVEETASPKEEKREESLGDIEDKEEESPAEEEIQPLEGTAEHSALPNLRETRAESPIKPLEGEDKGPLLPSASPERPPKLESHSPTEIPAYEEQPPEEPLPPEKAANEPLLSPAQDRASPVEEGSLPVQETALSAPFPALPDHIPSPEDLETGEKLPLEEEKRPMSPEKEADLEIRENPVEIEAESADLEGNSPPEGQNQEQISPLGQEGQEIIGEEEGNQPDAVEKPILGEREEEFSADLEPKLDQSEGKAEIEGEIKQEERPQSPIKPIEASEAAETELNPFQQEGIMSENGENAEKGEILPEASSEVLPIPSNAGNSDPVQPSDPSPQP